MVTIFFFTCFAQNSPRGLFVVIFILLCCLLYRFLFYLFIFNLFFVIEPRASLSVYRRYPISYFLRFVSPTFLKMSWWIFSVVRPDKKREKERFPFCFLFFIHASRMIINGLAFCFLVIVFSVFLTLIYTIYIRMCV